MKKIALIVMFFCMTAVNADYETKRLLKETGAVLAVGIVGSILNSATNGGLTKWDLSVNVNELSPKEQKLYKDCKKNKTATSTLSCEELASEWQYGLNRYGFIDLDWHFKAYEKLVQMLDDRYYEDCEKNNNIKACDKWLNYENNNRQVDMRKQHNKNKEINALEKACTAGMPKHCQTLGQIYENDKNYKKAIEFYKIGCDYANESSCSSLKNIE